MSSHSTYQTTLGHSVSCHGVALHSGQTVSLNLKPAPADSGICFKRTDVAGEAAMVPARYDAVCDTRLHTVLGNGHGTQVMTSEHLMAALWGCGIDNALIELDGPEVPIMDGSSEPFVFLIECAGTVQLDAPRRVLEVMRTVAVEVDGATAVLTPSLGFELDVTIQFEHEAIGSQRAYYDFEQAGFKQMLSRARTFGFTKDVEALRQAGLARGGSLKNAVVLDEASVLNEEGLRYGDEFVRHKALDCVGDYYLAGGHIRGAVTTVRPGHHINNQLLKALFADAANYCWRELAPELPASRMASLSASGRSLAMAG